MNRGMNYSYCIVSYRVLVLRVLFYKYQHHQQQRVQYFLLQNNKYRNYRSTNKCLPLCRGIKETKWFTLTVMHVGNRWRKIK